MALPKEIKCENKTTQKMINLDKITKIDNKRKK